VRPAIVTVALRCGPVLLCTPIVTFPVPLPDAPCEIDNQGATVPAVHVQPTSDVTVTAIDPPALPIVCDVLFSVNVHPVVCVTENV
jgi:hypothetical protein